MANDFQVSDNKEHFLLMTDAAKTQGQNLGNFSKRVKARKAGGAGVKSTVLPMYVKEGDTFYPVGARMIEVIDMEQFKENAPAE